MSTPRRCTRRFWRCRTITFRCISGEDALDFRMAMVNLRSKARLLCHPERSEGSLAFEGQRSFAALRMTIGITLAAGLCVFFVGASSAGGVRTLGGKTYDGAASINSAGKILVSPSNAAPAQVDLDDVLDAALG